MKKHKFFFFFQNVESLIQSCTEINCHTTSQYVDVLLKALLCNGRVTDPSETV